MLAIAGVAAGMQRLGGEDLEQDRAERVDIGARRRGDALDLLGRHVARRAEHRAGLGPVAEGVDLGVARRSPVVGEHARDAPVEHVDLAVVAEHDVRGLEIAVHDAARVRELDREADVDERAQQRLERPAIRQALGERDAREPLHREVRLALRIGAELVHRHDRRVIEARLDPRLAQEPR